MKKVFGAILLCLILFTLFACGRGNPESSVPMISEHLSSEWADSPLDKQSESDESSAVTEGAEEPESSFRKISVQFGENIIIYELNDGTAADSLYDQLPMTIEVENYSTNEKIFYPKQKLDTSNSPVAQAGAGTLAYFEPWGDVVFFYGDYDENPSLFELGQVLSGDRLISRMSNAITLEVVE